MENNKTYRLLLAKMQEIALVPPQTVGPFTFIYKKFVPYLKFSPWYPLSFIALFTSILLYLMLGSTFIKIVSLLQFGF